MAARGDGMVAKDCGQVMGRISPIVERWAGMKVVGGKLNK